MAASDYEVEDGVYECPNCSRRFDQDDYERPGGAARAISAHLRACEEEVPEGPALAIGETSGRLRPHGKR